MNLLQDICVQHSIESAEEETKKNALLQLYAHYAQKLVLYMVCIKYVQYAQFIISVQIIQTVASKIRKNVFLIKGLCID